ncbi:MAG TPA: efflux RND transporter permease subunit [Myxococcota bacterium]|nr:efflux RND transporter permease subunit [Myxococcota bacterium]
MRVAKLAVERPQLTLVLFAMLVAVGVSALRTIPRAEDPSFPMPMYVITAVHPGASPRDLEELVVDPLEDRVRELDGLRKVESSMQDGFAVTFVEFDYDEDPDRKYEEVVREVNALRPELPAELARLEIERFRTTEVAILQIALLSETAPFRELERQAERLEDRLEVLPGVKEVETWAYPESQVRVRLDPAKLERLNVPLSGVLGALEAGAANVPGGAVEQGQRRFNVETGTHYESLDEVRDSVVAGDGARLVRVRDVAQVEWGYAEETHRARVDGRRAVFVTLEMRDNQHIFHVRDRAVAVLDAFRESVPAEIDVALIFDQSRNVAHRLDGLYRDFALAIGLVLLTLLPLGVRAASIVMLSIPLSLAIGVALLQAFDLSLNQLSIVGFVIALGLLVDDSIVVTENVTRFLRAGASRREAAIRATQQIGVAVLGCTATLILAFLPLLSLPGGAGKYIRGLPLAVIFTVGASLLVSLTIIPFLASFWLSDPDAHENRALRWVQRGIEASYRPLLHFSLKRPVVTLFAAFAFVVASFALVPVMGLSFFGKAGIPQFRIRIESAEGSTLAMTDAAARFTERVLAKHPAIERVITNVGHGNPQIFYNVRPLGENTRTAELFVHLREWDPFTSPQLLDALRAELADYPSAKIRVFEFQNGPPLENPIQIRVTAEQLEQLPGLARDVEDLLAATPGTRYVDNPLLQAKLDLAVRVDNEQAGRLGVPELEIKRAVRLAIAGLEAGVLRDAAGEEHPVRVTLDQPGRASLAALDRLSISARGGAQVPLRQLAHVELEDALARIDHRDGVRSASVTADVQRAFNTDRVTQDVLDRLAQMHWPAGAGYLVEGELEERQESFGGLGIAMLIAAFGVLAVLVLEFRTFKSTLIVASVIPLGVAGGLCALFVVGESLSFTAMIGFIALVGIEVKNSILLVDFTNQLRAQGVALDEAIERAGRIRFFPILLTTLTALGGLFPLALEGSPLYSPLAIVIMGGLVSSTLLARLVTPVLYKLLVPEVHPDDAGEPIESGGTNVAPPPGALAT